MRELRAKKKLYDAAVAEERRVEWERAEVVAEKAAEKQRNKEEQDYQKALQTSQKGNCKVPRATALRNKRRKASGGGAAPTEAVHLTSATIV